MLKPNLPSKKVLVFTLLAIALTSTLASNSVFANVYKWRDSTGRTQYSDTPPATSYSIVKRSELINALQSKDVCTVPNTKSKLRQLSANFDFKVLGGRPRPAVSVFNQVLTTGSTAITTATIASITRFVASNAMPATVRPAAVSPAVKPASTTVANSTPKPVSTPIPVATTPAPTTVAINLPPNIVQTALMPKVDISKNMVPAIGYSVLRLEPTTEKLGAPTGGAFRIFCGVSHMANDDPIIFPNQPGASHHHTFFGNTSTNAKSDLKNLNAYGNSTCNGGIMNKSAYWIPSMIDTTTNTPVVPDGVLVYYKSGDLGYVGTEPIITPPKGLRMIAGNPKATPFTPDPTPWSGTFTCNTPNGTTPWSKTIPNCNVGDALTMHINFPQCWDGVNLDSPDHKSHMADRVYLSNTSIVQTCPADHPVKIPAITINVNFSSTKANQMLNWRLASDNYASTIAGGYSAHADWVNGWDEKLLAGIIKNCIQAELDCHAHLLGDGRKMY